jgi:membrane-associated phospholipid phosphatase
VTRLRAALGATLVCAALCAVCILYVDRPVELFVYGHQRFRRVFQLMAAPSLLSLPFALTYLTGYVIAARFTWPPGVKAQRYIAVSVAILVATAMKDEMKWMFGRPWPRSWVKNGVYGFHPFTDSSLYGGFPSGHTAYISAPLLLLCWLAPKYRWVWLAVVAMVMVGLVGAGYHFVGDTIAGLFVGLAAAAGTWVVMPKEARSL